MAYEGASELTSSAPAGSCGFGIAYRILKKNVHYPKKIIYCRYVRFPFLSSEKPIKHAKKKIHLTRLFSE